ncbi:MAG: hypothetical protein AUK16_03150 [Parcubacteria group bacterium CG2_30_44_11]|nr:MAG: hypothetical protein AUK16_03150 [Parcubacteria group bacterium CG2_30_44_11]
MTETAEASFKKLPDKYARLKELVAITHTKQELEHRLKEAAFSYFRIRDWNESEDNQAVAEELAPLFADVDMFQNANGKWVMVSIDPNSQF